MRTSAAHRENCTSEQRKLIESDYINTDRLCPRHKSLKLFKINDKEGVLKAVRGKKTNVLSKPHQAMIRFLSRNIARQGRVEGNIQNIKSGTISLE